MPAGIIITRASYGDNDTLDAAAFDAITIVSALVPDATTGTLGVIQLAGDLSGIGTAPTIAAKAVTLAKMADLATDKLFGRATAGTGAVELITCTAFARSILDDADAAAMRTTLGLGTLATANVPVSIANGGTASTTQAAARTALGLAIGTDVQAYHLNLAQFAGLSFSVDKAPYFTAANTMATMTVTSLARTLLSASTTANMLSTLGVGSNGTRDVTISSSSPSGGANGDVWLKY